MSDENMDIENEETPVERVEERMEERMAERVEVGTIAPSPLNEPPEGVSGVNEEFSLDMIMDIPVDVHVEIGNTSLPVKEFLRLGVGSVVQLDRLVGEPADLIVNGKLIGRGDVVVVDETFGIRISDLVGEKELRAAS
ncbi:MAG: flagellar motor switch protein FliN [Pontiellaceae bacterium]|nr:flagellar motor switch protein FliN [Pontiellaceae bacterium]MBN2784125.1 flagellar motor switch protein FliN [Pontiellaceae bacterium]